MAADDGGSGLHGDALYAPHVVEVRVAHEHGIGSLDVDRRKTDSRRARHSIDVAVEKDHDIADGEPKRGHPQPVERHRHAGTFLTR